MGERDWEEAERGVGPKSSIAQSNAQQAAMWAYGCEDIPQSVHTVVEKLETLFSPSAKNAPLLCHEQSKQKKGVCFSCFLLPERIAGVIGERCGGDVRDAR